MCDSRRPLEGADSEPLENDPLERRAEKRPFSGVPEWRRRAMEAHEANPWGAVTDLTEAAS